MPTSFCYNICMDTIEPETNTIYSDPDRSVTVDHYFEQLQISVPVDYKGAEKLFLLVLQNFFFCQIDVFVVQQTIMELLFYRNTTDVVQQWRKVI